MKHGNKSGLMAKKVHTRTGMRTYWVKAGAAAKRAGAAVKKGAVAAGRTVAKHKGKIAAAAALTALGLYGAHRNKSALEGAFRGAQSSWKVSGASKNRPSVRNRVRAAVDLAMANARIGHSQDKHRVKQSWK